jgi:hypothetical protein
MGIALGFGWALSLTLAVTYGYAELLSPGMRSGMWALLGLVWLGLLAISIGWDSSPLDKPKSSPDTDSYPLALDYYLKGNWFQAERLLRERLEQEPRDLEARLTLATLLRHTRRPADARAELERLERFEGARRWVWEIQRERELLTETPEAVDEEQNGSELASEATAAAATENSAAA